ncbi:FMN-binding negative transcriptional regulator [Sphingobacterium prati]|uniref:FMN-binding negative transcriptional regulator n=1 Tax=Sphingobacterium prati TaxID=2737006 RepID=UPI001554F2FB|nr:FMN-binding negative transcriptional regulator [Sphingobacterium prati]NPE45637.1 FMN-binding negative transcriptional regulator [Sphingobacterium prati]
MYVPKHFQFEDYKEQVAFMKQYSFATIVSIKDDRPIATQLPFEINEQANKLFLTSHFAIANEQTNYIEANTSLVIFSEPHAYISPIHYDKAESVPTWDYIAVHAYGTAKIITEEEAKLNALEQMIRTYDNDYLTQWQGLSDRFKKGMMRGIVAFELEVTTIQGQKKISQNKTASERERIAAYLENGDNQVEKSIAESIRNL